MRKPICHIFAAGEYRGGLTTRPDDIIIAADAGYNHLARIGVEPDILVGDFDTISAIPPYLENVVRFPREKDYTDTHLAINEGISHGYTNFVIYGALGGKRLEHTIANIQLAAGYTKKGCSILLTDGEMYAYTICNSSISFDCNAKGIISVFSISDKSCGVTIEGLKYELNSAKIENGFALGVSNEFTGKPAKISVNDGTLLILSQIQCNNEP